MRYGFTTGSCAAAAAKAAAYMLLSGRQKNTITIETPKGIPYTAEILAISRGEKCVRCAVRKDGGDDPDITSGTLVYAQVVLGTERTVRDSHAALNGDAREKEVQPVRKTDEEGKAQVYIDGGIGVGRVTKPGLDQPVGNAAINHVPREMIEKEVLEVCTLFDYKGTLNVEISVPEGEELAKQTFNPRLGIVGGISILGTSGIVEPMSNQALLDTIKVELNQRHAEGVDYVAVAPGNYGLDFMKKAYGYDLDRSVKCSNFIGATIDMAAEMGFRKMLLTGHIGKLIKVAGGIMNTHSKEGDCRMELLTAFAIHEGVSAEAADAILDCVTTEEAVRLLGKAGKQQEVMDYAMERILFYLNRRAAGRMRIDCIMYDNAFGELAKSKEADQWFTLLERDREQSI